MKGFTYTLLESVMDMYKKVGLGDILLLACQHLLEPQKRMFELLLKAGLKKENCIIIGKGYSTNKEVMNSLEEYGCIVAPFSDSFDPLRNFDEWFEEKLIEFVERQLLLRKLEDYRKVIVLDDGGFLHLVVNKVCKNVDNIIGVEQTSSGHNKIVSAQIRFGSISVARSHHKLTYESPYIGRVGYEGIVRHLRRRQKHNPHILVYGMGSIGRCTAGRLFMLKDKKGFATDIRYPDAEFIHEHRVNQIFNREGRILSVEDALSRIHEFDVIVGTTGSSLFAEPVLSRLHPEVSLISMSSSDREFPSVPFRYMGGRIHDDYYLEGKCLVNGGFPITFDGFPHGMPPQQIEFTVSLLLARIMDEVSNHKHALALIVERLRDMWRPDKDADEWYTLFHNR